MANINLQTRATNKRAIDPVVWPAHPDQYTLPAAEAITAGAPVRLDETGGRWTNANASTAAEATDVWIALATVAAGQTTTAFKRGVLEGYDLGGLAYGAPVYLSATDGRLTDTAPSGGTTVVVLVGRVIPGTAERGAYAKLLRLAL